MLDTAHSPAAGALLDISALDALAAAARQLEVPGGQELRWIDRPEAAELVDGLLCRVSRRLGAVEVAMGERLHLLERRGGHQRLGYSVIGDLAREKLGMSASLAEARAKLAGQLRTRPLLRAAVSSGEVNLSAAETIVEVAVGDEERTWVEDAKVRTVRALAAAVAKRRGKTTPDPDEEDRLYRLRIPLGTEIGPVVGIGLDYAGIVLGPTSSRADRFAAMSMEYFAAHPLEAAPDGEVPYGAGWGQVAGPRTDLASVGVLSAEAGAETDVPGRGADAQGAAPRTDVPGLRFFPKGPHVGDPLPEPVDLCEILEREMNGFDYLVRPEPFDPPDASSVDALSPDPHVLLAELMALASVRAHAGEVVGHLGLITVVCGLWRTAGFYTLPHYCKERLGMSASALKQRVALERRMYELPCLREAVRDGRLSYEQARIVSWVADESSIASWIEKAQGMTCIALRRLIEDEELGQMSRTGELKLDVPARVDSLLADAFTAARLHHKTWLTPEQCLFVIVAHFIDTYRVEVERRLAQASKVVKRDRGRCQVPGCSRHADQQHHIHFRSHGGSDDPANQVSVCWIHHRSIHLGYVMVTGRAPDGLTWILGEREVAAAHQ